MDSWIQAIVEWVNCLGIAETPIEDLRDLHDGVFYQKLVSQLYCEDEEASETVSWTTPTTAGRDDTQLVSRLVQTQYPEFANSEECQADIPDDLYLASLLLVHCSQKAAFHSPMCRNLEQRTQMNIKKFLELVLPYGKSLTKEAIGLAISELNDDTPAVSFPLREFFYSSDARLPESQRIVNHRDVELRSLRAQLETERFEKTDLMDCIRIQEQKFQTLEKQLQDKSQELKRIRGEQLKPPSPQLCRKTQRLSDSEERLKRELKLLEDVNSNLILEIDILREEHEELNRRYVSKDELQKALKQKFDETEKSLEALVISLEIHKRELIDMRMKNDEMREHSREIQRCPSVEHGIEPFARAKSPVLFNSNETLSSIIEIQLQEAKEESRELKIQLDASNGRLETVMHEFENMKLENASLEERANEVESVGSILSSTKKQLRSSEIKVSSLESEKSKLSEKLTQLEAALRCIDEERLASTEKCRETLESGIKDTESKIRDLKMVFCTKTSELLKKMEWISVTSERKLTYLRATLEKLKTELDAERSRSVELKRISEELESSLLSKDVLLEESLHRESWLDAELESSKLVISILQSSLSSESSRIDEIVSEVSSALEIRSTENS